MMSTTLVSAGAAASGYYKTEGYYLEGSEEGDAAAAWFGDEAQRLGLEGRIDDGLFSDLLEGQTYEPGNDGLVKGRLMGVFRDGERQHRAGLDITFSAPKSVSVAALVYGDTRLVKAHDAAVQEAMSYVQANLAETRRKVHGELVVEKGGGLIAGLFRHDTSRALDPQLHTHAVIANMVRNSSGNITALHNDAVFKAQKLGSEIYRASLAKAAQDMGYTVDRVGKERLIELREVSKDLVDQFSKRRAEIEKALQDRKAPDNARTAELAALATRASKHGGIDRATLHAVWQKQAQERGISPKDMEAVKQATIQRASLRLPGVTRAAAPPAPATLALQKSIDHLSETHTSFSEDALKENALRLGNGVDLRGIESAIEAATKAKSLRPAKADNGEQRSYTTTNLMQTERAIAAQLRAGMKAGLMPSGLFERGKMRSFASSVKRSLERVETLSPGQRDAIQTSLTGKSLFVGVQGSAGTGKTYMMSRLATLAAKAGYEVEGVAPSTQAVRELAEALPSAETLQARLLRGGSADKAKDPRKTILIVDEASMLDNRQMHDLMAQARSQNLARVVFVGDVKQLDSVNAGTPFALLQKSGMPTAAMTDIIRQRDDALKSVVTHAIAGEVQNAFAKLGNAIQASQDYAAGAAEAYIALAPEAQKQTGIVTPSNKVRSAINAHVRAGLQDSGKLGPENVSLAGLTPLRLSRVEAAETTSYRSGDVILVHQSVASAGFKKGQRLEVEHSGPSGLVLRDMASGEVQEFSPSPRSKAVSSIEVYEQTERQFSVGEAVKFRIADESQSIANGDQGRILRIGPSELTVELVDGQKRQLDPRQLAAQGMDHAYALTGHDMQGATVDRIIVAMGAREYLADQKSFYVGISRARDEATLVTDDPAKLAERLAQQTGEKISALEAYVQAIRERDHEKAEEHERSDKDDGRTERERPQNSNEERQTDTKSNEPYADALQVVRDLADGKDIGERDR